MQRHTPTYVGDRPAATLSLGARRNTEQLSFRLCCEDEAMRLGERASLAVAAALVLIGAARGVTDTLHEYDPDYWQIVAHSWLRYVIRAPSDGTLLGWLNAQWFKVLSVPAGLSLIYLRSRFGAGTDEEREAEFRDWAVSGVWIAVFLVGFTVIELQKQLAFLDLNTRLVAGEEPWLNHLAHGLSAALAWLLSRVLTIVPARESAPP
ncbi:MAG: hypothetical protein KC636_39245 [Myxococcales bacterium]|nr:hypothetical protein [Myxococcales bacterium]